MRTAALVCDIVLTASVCILALRRDLSRLRSGDAPFCWKSAALWGLGGANGTLCHEVHRISTPWPPIEGGGLVWSEEHIPAEALRRLPAHCLPTDQEKKRALDVDLSGLVDIAREAGAALDPVSFQAWLSTTVPDPQQYWAVGKNNQNKACEQNRLYLGLILLEMRRAHDPPSNAEKIAILERIDSHRTQCSPTWLRVAEEGYQRLKGAAGLEQRLLRHMVAIKSGLIQEDFQRPDRYFPDHEEWHVESVITHHAGGELGLPMGETMYLDTSVCDRPSLSSRIREQAFRFASELFLKETFVHRLLVQLELETKQQDGLDPEIVRYLTDGDWERLDLVKATYYTEVESGVFRLNERGGRKLLGLIGYC